MITRTDFETYLGGPAFIIDCECETLGKYAEMATGPVIEIGTGFGGSTVVLLCHTPLSERVISIDPFVIDSMGEWRANASDCVAGVTRAVNALRTTKHYLRWCLYPHPSQESTQAFDDLLPFGMVFVDGDHNYDAVRRDVEDWLPKLKPGGFLLIHDSNKRDESAGYNQGWPGPTRVADELRNDNRVRFLEVINSLTVFVKE